MIYRFWLKPIIFSLIIILQLKLEGSQLEGSQLEANQDNIGKIIQANHLYPNFDTE